MPTNLEKALKLMAELDATRQAAINELLEQRSDIDKNLVALGHSESKEAPKPQVKRVVQKKEGACPTCGFATEPTHDSRRHRFQGDQKKPLTDEQLKEFNMKKV